MKLRNGKKEMYVASLGKMTLTEILLTQQSKRIGTGLSNHFIWIFFFESSLFRRHMYLPFPPRGLSLANPLQFGITVDLGRCRTKLFP
jgi:hypothetical protein